MVQSGTLPRLQISVFIILFPIILLEIGGPFFCKMLGEQNDKRGTEI